MDFNERLPQAVHIKIINKSGHPLPSYETIASAGMDLRANIDAPTTLKPLERTIVKTGIFIELPIGFEAQVRPRSGLAAKKGITEDFTIENGERIAQMIISKHERAVFIEAEELSETERGAGGFGSTGVK